MNCSNKFKLTAVAMMVGTAMNANAALYQVVEVEPESNGDMIQQQDVQPNNSNWHWRLVLHLCRQVKL